MEANQRNRNQIPWEQEIWDRIDTAVHDECDKRSICS